MAQILRNRLRRNSSSLGLLVATAMQLPASLTHAADMGGTIPGLSQSSVTVQVQHQTIDLPCDFDVFNRTLVHLLGHYDPSDTLIAPTDLKKSLDLLHASQGEQGLMLFDGSNDHGALFPLIGKPARKAIRYHLGNPLIAVKMTQKNIGAALYAPLTILVYEVSPGSVRVEYDLPSSSFGQFHDKDIDQVAATLDSKLSSLLVKAAGAQR